MPLERKDRKTNKHGTCNMPCGSFPSLCYTGAAYQRRARGFRVGTHVYYGRKRVVTDACVTTRASEQRRHTPTLRDFACGVRLASNGALILFRARRVRASSNNMIHHLYQATGTKHHADYCLQAVASISTTASLIDMA